MKKLLLSMALCFGLHSLVHSMTGKFNKSSNPLGEHVNNVRDVVGQKLGKWAEQVRPKTKYESSKYEKPMYMDVKKYNQSISGEPQNLMQHKNNSALTKVKSLVTSAKNSVSKIAQNTSNAIRTRVSKGLQKVGDAVTPSRTISFDNPAFEPGHYQQPYRASLTPQGGDINRVYSLPNTSSVYAIAKPQPEAIYAIPTSQPEAIYSVPNKNGYMKVRTEPMDPGYLKIYPNMQHRD